jgi:hypothetical protein
MKPFIILRYLILALVLVITPILLIGQGIVIQNNTQLVATGSTSLVIGDGGFFNNGSYLANGSSVKFIGTAALQNSFIGGGTISNFYNLELSKSCGGLLLNADISVLNQLLLSAGDSFHLNNHALTLTSTAQIIGENESLRITGRNGGYLSITKNLTSPSNENPGNLGLAITSTANLGSVTIKRYNLQRGGVSIYRYYEITPAANSSLNASLTMSYFDHELGSITEANLSFYSNTPPSRIWALDGQTSLNTAGNSITMTGYNSLSQFTLADLNLYSFLPVSLLSMTANRVQGGNLIKWTTSSEINFDHYILEKSPDGRTYGYLAYLLPSHESSKTNSYLKWDYDPYPTITFYRLKQYDKDGSFLYSKVVSVDGSSNANSSIKLYPNPVTNLAILLVNNIDCEKHKVSVFNVNGNKVMEKCYGSVQGLNQISVDVQNLATGIYFLEIDDNAYTKIVFIKN